MLFSSTVFLFYFFPAVLVLYYIFRNHIKIKNMVLLTASLVFYAWGEPVYVTLMIVSVALNYSFALFIHKSSSITVRKLLLFGAVVVNLLILGYYKYGDFLISNINAIINTQIAPLELALPIGISFFTFQAMSYVIDVYRGDGVCQKNPFNVALYISLFPQLIAGPIVRYQTIADQIENRKETVEDFSAGIRTFFVGLAKKILLANTFALIADAAFNSTTDISVAFSWLGIISYTLQIYFDFSGYSDMAIGLGKMFGFHFLPNFDYPYISKSITEFWRRWHMSLGQWFRDYVYIPLGGSRKGVGRQYFNIAVVWLLTGIWHGANWTFILWGVYYGILLMIEKKFLLNSLNKHRIWSHIYAMLIVVVGWVFFRSNSIGDAFEYLKTMFGFNGVALVDLSFWRYLIEYLYFFIIGVIASTPLIAIIAKKSNGIMENHKRWRIPVLAISVICFVLMVVVTVSTMVSNTYNPFIYFNF